MSTGWMTEDRADLAVRRILDTAGELFGERGISAVTMRDLALAVGCSRATLYRYFPGKAELLAAYVDRSAKELGERIQARTRSITDHEERLITAITTALDGVRGDPTLAAWFAPEAAGQSTHLALLSPTIESITASFLDGLPVGDHDRDGGGSPRRAQWLVRIIVSLLTDPAPTTGTTSEVDLLRQFVLPVILPRLS